jgi:hypothetical protein
MSSGATIIDVERAPEHIAVRDGFDGLPPLEPGFTHAQFVRWLVGITLLAVLAIGAFNWVIDPTGVTGRVTRWRIGENAEVRAQKLDLYDAMVEHADAPEVVLLGSSRTMKFDPRVVQQLTGASAFNASVSGGVPRDAWLFTKLIEERQPRAFPHLVWGLDVDAFRDKQLRDGLATDPRMKRFIPRSERIATTLATAGTLVELQTLQASVRAVRAGGHAHRETKPGERFSDRGFQEWSLPFPRDARAREAAIRRQIAQYAGFIFERDAYEGVEDAPLHDFEDIVRIANRHGDVPTIFVTPYHPLAEQLLDRYELGAREREVFATLHRLQREGELRFEVVDLTDLASFGGDPTQFYDGVHMTPRNTRRVLERLDRDGLLAPPKT